MEAIVFFSDEQRAFDTMIARRWPEGVSCPVCKSNAVRFMSARRFWNCNGCRKQFSIKTGTIFEASPISLGKWLTAAWLIANAKNGISSCELARSIGVTQKSAWFMNHRIRLAMANGSIEKLSGEVEVDETYFGGKKIPGKPGRGASGKIPVVGAVERGGRVVTILSRNVSQKELTPFVQANVEPTAKVFTDDWSGYRKLPSAGFNHSTINHTLGFYTDGDIHTQNIESFWSLIKRTLKGTYVSVEPIHLHRYLGEYGFRFNERKANDGQRFVTVASQVTGKRLTYKQLTGKELAAGA
jgi:transposase-like protein/ribosomal protein L37AE/L43A